MITEPQMGRLMEKKQGVKGFLFPDSGWAGSTVGFGFREGCIRIRIRILFNGQVYYLHIQEMNLVWLVHRT